MIKQGTLITLMIGVIIGIIIGEHKTCVELNGAYNFEYGICKVGTK